MIPFRPCSKTRSYAHQGVVFSTVWRSQLRWNPTFQAEPSSTENSPPQATQSSWSDSTATSRGRKLSAFTLLETIVATVLVTITLVTSLNSMAFVTRATSHQSRVFQAVIVAQVLLSEITSQPFQDISNATTSLGPETDEMMATRVQWDDCDDYHGWNTSTITDRQNNPLVEDAGWNLNVSVSYADVNDPSTTSLTATKLKKITLSISSPSGRTFDFYSLRGESGTLQKPQPTGTSILSCVNIVAGTGSHSISVATRLHNQQEPN